ncbi:MAG: hypothetical protein ACTH8H_19160 [Serratia proteamaculans]|jgi:DNA-directed RNA polymerase specialized sigma subunit|uniref:hypothetical protein n=1 Tax=Serratia proteamaculans TaxID=28151 RepID=UPI002178CBC6|nr:hypothetical protein [Serratia proteamaculans]CAI0828625.1 Uncharacterised protein [Serratia proteamaculans]CAI0831512.1 Uncharacterised protein [Serratia proteamaculans]
MLDFMKLRRNKKADPDVKNDDEANDISAEISVLEQQLAATPTNSEIHKTLMLTYNRALKIYAKNKNHRQHIDTVFIKIDELRNIIRKSL